MHLHVRSIQISIWLIKHISQILTNRFIVFSLLICLLSFSFYSIKHICLVSLSESQKNLWHPISEYCEWHEVFHYNLIGFCSISPQWGHDWIFLGRILSLPSVWSVCLRDPAPSLWQWSSTCSGRQRPWRPPNPPVSPPPPRRPPRPSSPPRCRTPPAPTTQRSARTTCLRRSRANSWTK